MIISAIAYAIIITMVLILPHFPLGNKKYFKLLLRSQMTRDQYTAYQSNGYDMVLLLGSSSVERGVNENTLDSTLLAHGLSIRPSNSAAMGMFARMNGSILRIMLASGIKPKMIVYGFFLDELNGRSKIHDNTYDSISSKTGLKPKSALNLLLNGPEALSTILNAGTWPMYIYILHHAYNDVDHRNLFQRLIVGGVAPLLDSSFQFDSSYFHDFSDLCAVCRDNHIPLALCNTPIKPRIESVAAFPYAHRLEAYRAIQDTALFYRLPLWNGDAKGLFDDADFFDINHVNAGGAKKLARILGERIAEWSTGIIRQDVSDSTFIDSSTMTTGNLLLRTITHF
ncbi:MAG: hypothetical protein ACHQM6_03410 [Candidatus Kapaibacterium sp.]